MRKHDAKASRRPGAILVRNLQRSLIGVVALVAAGCASRTVAVPVRRVQGFYHVVRAGENLYRIGKVYNVSHLELARLNHLRDSSRISVGQKIFIPGATRQLPVEIITPAQTPPALSSPPETARQRSVSPAMDQAFIWPINGIINSGFGARGSSFHEGIDIAAPEGTPIHAVDGGEVIYSDELRGYGNMVIVRHTDGFASVYAHNAKNLVREGQQVARGETIARVGSTGRVTGPHLHFEIRRNNTAEDPLRYLPQLCCASASDNVAPGG
jgi:murein DD-endopeptidase MepM/ murein hydrolase activator NlpD